MRTEAQKRAKKAYKKKCRELRVMLYPTDQDIMDKIESVEQYTPYIKELIRKDIKEAGR